MSSKVKDITGQKFGRLTVLELDHIDSKGATYWKCKCDCGNEKVIAGRNLTYGATKSCGCYNHDNLVGRKGNIKYKRYLYE